MVGAFAVASLALLSAQEAVQQEPNAIPLRVVDGPSLEQEVRLQPDAARESLAESLLLAGSSSADPGYARQVSRAERIARVYADVWGDSIPLREVLSFRRMLPEQRKIKLEADSLRRAGRDAFRAASIGESIEVWLRSAHLSAAVPDSVGLAKALGNVGAAYYSAGRSDSARVFLSQARTIAGEHGDGRTWANAVTLLANLQYDAGYPSQAALLYTQVLDIHNQLGDTQGAAADHHNLGLVYRALGDPAEAQRQFGAALRLNEAHGHDAEAGDDLLGISDLRSDAGRYEDALNVLRRARTKYNAAHDPLGSARVAQRTGAVQARRGEYEAALQSYAEAISFYEETERWVAAADVRTSASRVHAAIGDLSGAVWQLDRSMDNLDSMGTQTLLRAEILLSRADLHLRFNRMADAREDFAVAGSLFRQAEWSTGVIEADKGLAYLALVQGDYREARGSLEELVRRENREGPPGAATWSRVLLAYACAELGDLPAARATLVSALESLPEDENARTVATVLGAQADLEFGAGSMVLAESLYRAAIERLSGLTAPEEQWRLLAGLGEVQAATGRGETAALTFRDAIQAMEANANRLTVEEARIDYLIDKWDIYARLAAVEYDLGHVEAAFEISELMRARRMLSMLSLGRQPAPADVPLRLAAEEQDLRRFVSGSAYRFAGLPVVAPTRDWDAQLHRSDEVLLETARTAYRQLLPEVEEINPAHHAVLSSRTATVPDLQGRLAPDELFLEYLVGVDRTLLFAVADSFIEVFEVGLTRRDLVGLIAIARGTMSTDAAVPDGWKPPLRRLYRSLILPVETAGLLDGKTRLVIAPHGELHYLPFQALLDLDDDFLVEHHALAYVPSATVWAELAEPASDLSNASLLAVAPWTARLPASGSEVDRISEIYSRDARSLLSEEATEGRVRNEASSFEILHFATTGVLNRVNPLYSHVTLRPGDGQDGRLEVREVFQLDLQGSLIVLSACETGLGSGALADVPAGDEWVGLVRAFLQAGASGVVASLWQVDDEATEALMVAFYQEMAGGQPPVEALAQAQRQMIHDAEAAQPSQWAAFVLTGSP